MPQVSPDALIAVQPELNPGESILWAGQPSLRIIFHSEDAGLIPFSLLWGGFAIFWEGGVAGYWGSGTPRTSVSVFMMLWGIPFVVIGQYFIWGRFLYAAWTKKKTYYAVTNRRVIVVQNGLKRQMMSAYIDSLPGVVKEGRSHGVGTLHFGQLPISATGRGLGPWNRMASGIVPQFMDIEDVDLVYRLVSDLREKASTAKPSAF